MNWNKSKEEIRANDSWQVQKTHSELVIGFDKLTDVGACISIFGSARIKEDNPYYTLTEEIAFKLSEKGYGIITGGGPGIMEAANKGAKRGGSASVGVGITLPFEMQNNSFIDYDKNLAFNYFHVRKVMFLKYSQGFVVLPGGYGSLDEMFEVLTLAQTEKTEEFPIFLVGSEYWKGLIDWLRSVVLKEGCVSESDFDLFRVVDTVDEVVESFEKFFLKYRKENKLNF
ncbi:MAG: hypothetical protein RLZZ546_2307 [Bacteroidota bacterium]|jgi:uncharacterized protein (TIGR00730 family)